MLDMKRKRCAAWILAFQVVLSVAAHDFVVTQGGNKLYFNIKNQTAKTAEVTYKGNIADRLVPEISGDVEIPAKVKHNNVVYTVTSIKAKAFRDAVGLTGIVLPSTITSVGEFAFEGCTALRKIIFPANDLTFGQGAFYKCTSIRDVTFGSDWTKVNLTMFRWSDSLVTLVIPAKMEKIQNLKKLKMLQSVEVDVNNTKFSSVSGVLYNKDRSVLYGCPRNYSGRLRVPEGTLTLTRGALIDCPKITVLDFPSSLTYVSFRETARMKHLKQIIFRGDTPAITAYQEGKGCFALQVANPDVELMVPNKSKAVYKDALVQQGGAFCETQDAEAIPYRLEKADMPLVKRINGVKRFDD